MLTLEPPTGRTGVSADTMGAHVCTAKYSGHREGEGQRNRGAETEKEGERERERSGRAT